MESTTVGVAILANRATRRYSRRLLDESQHRGLGQKGKQMKFPYVEIRSVPSGYMPVLRGFDDGMSYQDVSLLRYERLIGNLDAIPPTQKDARKLAARILRELAQEIEKSILESED